jgi:hypothetical protein
MQIKHTDAEIKASLRQLLFQFRQFLPIGFIERKTSTGPIKDLGHDTMPFNFLQPTQLP